jgi:hypothetical protein
LTRSATIAQNEFKTEIDVARSAARENFVRGRKSRRWRLFTLLKIVFSDAKRLLQHYRPISEVASSFDHLVGANSIGRQINGGGTDGMSWPAMIARCSSSWPLPALNAAYALSGSKKTPIGSAANSREES